MAKKAVTLEKGDIGGTLDIGAGDRPIPQARVAADINIPTKPRKKPFKRKIKVIVDKTAEEPLGLPVKLTKSHKLRVYWAGDSKDLPDNWEGKFDKVFSNSSVGIFKELSTRKMGKEIASMLRDGGKVEIIANSDIGRTKKDQEKIDRNHIKKTKDMLSAGGLKNIRVMTRGGGFFTFFAEKPVSVSSRSMRAGRLSSNMPRISPKTPKLR